MYTFDSRIRYTEINHNKGIMDPSSILNYFQDCSTFQSEDMNLGFSKPDSCRRAWLLVSWNLQIIRQVSLGEYVTVGTWPYGFKGFYGYRNFIMKDSNGQVTSVADSIWVFMDMETGYPAKIPGDGFGYKLEPPYPMDHKSRKIAIPDKLEDLPPFPVAKRNIDSYRHVNNVQYVKMAEEYLPDDYMVTNLRVEYKTQAVFGDIIYPGLSQSDGKYIVILSGADKAPYAIVEFTGHRRDKHD